MTIDKEGMIELSKTCPLCSKELQNGKDPIHFNCKECEISWHREDLYGKIDKIKKILKKPKNKSSLTYLQQERNAVTLLHSRHWYIWGVKNTINKETKRRTDILLINKFNKTEFKIFNWKRCHREKGESIHSWHYELYLDDKLLTDGEYTTNDYRKARQSDFIHYLMNLIGSDYNELYTEIVDCGHRTDQIVHKNGQRLCLDCYWRLEPKHKELK
jgi:hypothetical protein